MVKIINKVWKVPWKIAEAYDELQFFLRDLEVITQHIFREGNKLADYMANLAVESSDKQIFNSFQQVPTMGKKIINADKALIPSLRFKSSYQENLQATGTEF